MKISTNWLKDFVTLAPPLERIADHLTMAGLEVKRIEPCPECKDTVFEVEVTTNRPDWLSHLGVAREIHAVENTGLKLPPVKIPAHPPMPTGWKIDLKEAEGCPYYTACLVEGVKIAETPDWMRNRLLACGIRSINLIVDITNYVLLETGQPLHAFDADLLHGQEVVIRRAKPQEALIAIDSSRYTLSSDDLVIADRERAVALAGIMGGQESEVTQKTRNLLLESAFFHPRWVRKSSLRLGMASESSYRFERRVDPEGVDLGRERAVHLFLELCGARSVSAALKAGRKPTLEKSRLHLSLEQVRKILGTEIKPHQVHSVLTRIGLEPKNENPENWVVTVPSYRADLQRPVDLVEEIARIEGYEKIPETLPERAPVEILPNPLRELEERTRDFLAGLGLFETVTFSLVNPAHFEAAGADLKDSIQIQNPIHQELTLLRPSFLVSLVEVLARNERTGVRSASFFEVANLYSKKGKGGQGAEEKSVGILIAGEREAGWSDSKREMNYFDLKGILESYLGSLGLTEFSFQPQGFSFLERGAQVRVEREPVGCVGEISRSVLDAWDLGSNAFFAELSLEKLIPLLPRVMKFTEFPRYPAVERDLSVVVGESVTSAEIVEFIQRQGGESVRRIDLFDLFRGGRIPTGQKNLAFRLTYQSFQQTLLSEDVQKLHQKIAEEVARKFQASFQEKA